MQYMKWYLILNWTLIRDGQFWKCEETNSFYTLSQISFLMYLSQKFRFVVALPRPSRC